MSAPFFHTMEKGERAPPFFHKREKEDLDRAGRRRQRGAAEAGGSGFFLGSGTLDQKRQVEFVHCS